MRIVLYTECCVQAGQEVGDLQRKMDSAGIQDPAECGDWEVWEGSAGEALTEAREEERRLGQYHQRRASVLRAAAVREMDMATLALCGVDCDGHDYVPCCVDDCGANGGRGPACEICGEGVCAEHAASGGCCDCE